MEKRKPNKAEYNKYNSFIKRGGWSDEEMEFLNEIDMSTNVFEENGKHVLKNC